MSKSQIVSTKQQRIAKLAKDAPDMAMDLSHHMDAEWFREAYRLTRKDGAVGVDGETATEFAERLEERLEELINLAKSGRYRAPAVRRVHIPKGKGNETRPLGIPAFSDKVLQRAVVMALEPVYEQDFLNCSYGFRPGRSPKQALEALQKGIMKMRGGYVIDMDIRKYFDTVSKRLLQDIFAQRVRDGVLRRLIGKWLNAGVMEEGQVTYSEIGVPQGGVISPLLSNIYLHEVLDTWFEKEVKPRLHGDAFMIRYCDDAVIVCKHREDAERLMAVLPKRFEKYGLTIHPEKTKLVSFIWYPPGKDPGPKHENRCFDFLGFTHYWALARKSGKPMVKRKTAKNRVAKALTAMNTWLSKVRHWPIAQQHEAICRKIAGHRNYYGIVGNISSINRYIRWTAELWRKWLGRRSHKARNDWQWFNEILRRFPLIPARPRQLQLPLSAKP